MLSADLKNIASSLQIHVNTLNDGFAAEYGLWLQSMEENLCAIAEQVEALEQTPLALEKNVAPYLQSCLFDTFSYEAQQAIPIQ